MFDRFDKSSLATSLTDKQIEKFTATLVDILFKFNNNSDITLEYLVKNLKIVNESTHFSKNKEPSRPFIFIDTEFMLETTVIAVRISVEFNSSCCFIPLTYHKYDIVIQKTDTSDLFKVLNLYKPNAGVSYFYFRSYKDDFDYTVTTMNAFKFQHNFSLVNLNRFYIEYSIKKNKIVSSKIINDTTRDYLTYENKPLSDSDETLFIYFANAAYTKEFEFINSFVKDTINFNDMECFAQLKTIFLKLYKSEHRDNFVRELLLYQMVDI